MTFFSFLFFFGLGVRYINKRNIEKQLAKCKLHQWEIFNGMTLCMKCRKTPQEISNAR